MKIPKYRKDKLKDNYDVIIIGSGISGLCSAALLSMEGKKVLVLKKHLTETYSHIRANNKVMVQSVINYTEIDN